MGAHCSIQVPLSSFVGEACVLDITEKARRNRDYLLTVDDINEWEQKHGKIGPGCIVLLNTGQAAYWPDAERFYGTRNFPDMSTFHFSGWLLIIFQGFLTEGLQKLATYRVFF